ncbi:hypothetical protein L6R52_24840 [Myxococcota bacterium]|nr:hypothetical protein [Myxococcota bacterium]
MIPWARFERRWLEALLAAMIPPSAARPGLAALDLDQFLDALFTAAPPLLRFGVRAATWALTLGPPVFLGRISTFGGLSEEERDRMLVRVATSRSYLARQLAITLKLVASFGYLRAPEVRATFPSLSDEVPRS